MGKTLIFAAAASALAFNLVCTGTLSSTSTHGTESEFYSSVYRIDLDAKKWCEGECSIQHDFAAISPVELTLEAAGQREELSNVIDRKTGKHTVVATSGTGPSTIVKRWKGTCKNAIFTGFPKTKPKS